MSWASNCWLTQNGSMRHRIEGGGRSMRGRRWRRARLSVSQKDYGGPRSHSHPVTSALKSVLCMSARARSASLLGVTGAGFPRGGSQRGRPLRPFQHCFIRRRIHRPAPLLMKTPSLTTTPIAYRWASHRDSHYLRSGYLCREQITPHHPPPSFAHHVGSCVYVFGVFLRCLHHRCRHHQRPI